MVGRLRSWWQKVKKPLEVFAIFVGCLVILALLVVIILTYIFKVNVPGLSGKNIWDWLQLLIIPAVLAVGGYVFTYTTSRNDRAASEKRTQAERDIALDNQHEQALQAYLDKMSELLLKEHLGERTEDGQLKPEYEQARRIARVRIITMLKQLDGRRVGYVFAFLREAELMSVTKDDNAISLKNADLQGVDWSQADLRGADLRGTNLSGANLSGAIFSSITYVPRAFGGTLVIPNRADLSGADLSQSNLKDAKGITIDELEKQVKSLKGATMSDGSIHS